MGTQEALNYIRGTEQIETRPKAIADAINVRLGDTQYPATQERVAAIVETLYELAGALQDVDLEITHDVFFSMDYEKKTIRTGVDRAAIAQFAKIFREANKCGVNDDQSMQKFLAGHYLAETLRKKGKKVPKKVYVEKTFDEFVKLFGESKYAEYDILARTFFSPLTLSKRMRYDRVELQKEHQQEMIDLYLKQGGFETVTAANVTDATQAYSAIVHAVVGKIKMRKERLERLRGLNVPDVTIQREEDMVEQAALLRQAFGREKTYVLRRLDQYLKA